MKHFKLIRRHIDPLPLLCDIASVGGAWSQATGRQQKIEVQREALGIPLLGLRASAIAGRPRRDVHECRWTSGAAQYPLACRYLEDTARALDSLPGRAKIVCLPAGQRVYPHIYRGEYDRVRDRYHLVLHSTAGSWLKAGDEEVRMRAGELPPRGSLRSSAAPWTSGGWQHDAARCPNTCPPACGLPAGVSPGGAARWPGVLDGAA